MMMPNDFSQIRREAGLSQEALAARIRVGDLRTIRRYETGERAIPGPVALLMELMRDGKLP